MKALLFVATCLLLITACSKSSVTPDAGNVVAGTYALTLLQLDSANVNLYKYDLPITQGSNSFTGTIVARRDSASVVFMTQTVKITGYNDQSEVIGQVSLKSNGAGYDMYQQGQKIGTADGTSIIIDYQYTGTVSGSIYRARTTAKK